MRKALFFGIVLIFGIIVMSSVYADPTSPTNLQVYGSGSRTFGGESNGTISARGGNVTQVNIDGLTITTSWQGYYGNVTGSIHLDDSTNSSFYVWGNATPSGEVYATRNSTILWASINCSNTSQISQEETYLGQFAVDADSVSKTFNATNHPSFYVGTVFINSSICSSTNVNVNGSVQNQSFYQILLSDNASNTVYTTIIEDDVYGYNSELADFQLLVGENEKSGNEGPTSYYFFVELS